MNRENIQRITQPVLERVLTSSIADDIILDGHSLELMYEIQKELNIFEPIDDDEARLIWLEIPRGTTEEWKILFNEEVGPTQEEQQEFYENYPLETKWISLTTATYHELTTLHITDRCHKYRVFCNEDRSSESVRWDMTWFLEPLLILVRQKVSEILKDPQVYYRYIEEELPYRQRYGRIRSKDLNRIVGRSRNIENSDYCIHVMKELIKRNDVYASGDNIWQRHNVPAPLESMTIRTFCHYYHIADKVFRKGKDWMSQTEEIDDDIEYYTHNSLHDNLSNYNLDKQEDFIEFAKDHYGELGLSRMNVGATDHYVMGKWIITFSFSYSAYLFDGMEIAIALYETGVPFIFHNARNVLHALEETGWVRISPHIFHDYITHGDDEGVFKLPYKEFCDQEEEITSQQYDEIVNCAEWNPECQLIPDHIIPLESNLYDAIWGDIEGPMTISGIRHFIEDEYDIYLHVVKDTRTQKYYYMSIQNNDIHIKAEKEQYFNTFNEAMAALITLFNKNR